MRVLIKYDLDGMLRALNLFPYSFIFRLIPVGKKVSANIPRGDRICLALEELGPIFVKFGQVLSTRPDLLSEDIAKSLTKLQDKVPPFPGNEAKAIIEAAYGESLDSRFHKFEMYSIASASVSQVHYAELMDGTEVVVKVLRPGIEPVIERDIELLYTLARLMEKYWSEGERFKPREIVQDYDKTIHNELDLKREAANASQLKSNFKNSNLIHVPRVYWEHTYRNVIVMERIYGIPIRDIEQIKTAGINMRKLAHDGVEIFFIQAFRDGFFHADMHPGNIFVAPNGQYRAVDFGIMGTLSIVDKRYLAENLLAFFNRDYQRVANAHIRAGWVPLDTNAEDFEGAIRTVCEPIFARPISELSFSSFLIDLFRVARQFNMPVQPQLVLLQKTLFNIEGLGRQIYPQLNLWETAKPFLEQWMSKQIGPKAIMRTIKRELPNLFTLAPEIPVITRQLMCRIKNDEMRSNALDKEVTELKKHLTIEQRKTMVTVLGTGLLVIIFMLLPDRQNLSTMPMSGWIAVGTGIILLFFAFTKSSQNKNTKKD